MIHLIQDILLNSFSLVATRGGPISVVCLCISHHSKIINLRMTSRKLLKLEPFSVKEFFMARLINVSCNSRCFSIVSIFSTVNSIHSSHDWRPQQTASDFHFKLRELNLCRDELILNLSKVKCKLILVRVGLNFTNQTYEKLHTFHGAHFFNDKTAHWSGPT